MTKQEIDTYLDTYKNGLLGDIIPFWLRHSVDREHGGFMFALDRNGSIVDTDKGVWQQGRCTWMLATLYNEVERRAEWLELAEHGARFLEEHCIDKDGRMFFIVDRHGRPVRKRRYVFSESFASIAFAALYKATGNTRYKERAMELFNVFYKYATTPGLIPPKFSDDRQMKGMGHPMIGIVTAQELRKNLDDPGFSQIIDMWIEEIRKDFIKEEFRAVMEAVGPNGEFIDHFDGRTLNPGHAIEGAWFILNEAAFRE